MIEVEEGKERTLQTHINTLFNGRGFFFFTPLAKKEYVLSIPTQQGTKIKRVPIPIDEINDQYGNQKGQNGLNMTIHMTLGVFGQEETMTVDLKRAGAQTENNVILTITSRTQILNTQTV